MKWFDLNLELTGALNGDLGELPYVLEILDLSPVCLGSNKLTYVASIGVRPTEGKTRDIMPHFSWKDPA